MPLAVGTGTALAPTPVVVQPGVDVGRARATWTAPDGSVWLLDVPSEGWCTPDEVSGLGAAPISLVTDAHPRGGARVRHIQPQPRTITWPLLVEGTTHGEFLGRWRALADAFVQTRRLGPGTLRIARPDGTWREIQAYYEAGYDGEPGQGHTWDTVVLSLWCEDPYWMGPEVADFRAYQAAADPFLNPFMTVADSQVLGATTVFNPGSVEAWPVWTITGPATDVTATNTTTDEAWVLTPDSLGAGDVATVTTDPPAVRGPADEIWTGLLDWPASALWGLQPGLNSITFAVSDAAAGTRIDWSYRPRYDTA